MKPAHILHIALAVTALFAGFYVGQTLYNSKIKGALKQ